MVLKILIANNSLSAYKFVHSMKKTKLDCEFYGMATAETLHQTYIKYLKNFVMLKSGEAKENFSNIQCVLDAAKLFEVDYVYPGWGYLSENSEFARKLNDMGYKFIGPSHKAMHLLGNKLVATKLAADLGIPTIPFMVKENKIPQAIEELPLDEVIKMIENNSDVKTIFGSKKIAMYKLLPDSQKRKLLKKITFDKLCKFIPKKNYAMNVSKLQEIWQKYMPKEGQENIKINNRDLDSDIVAFVEVHGFPLILKGAITGGGSGIYMIETMNDLQKIFQDLPDNIQKELMVCKFIKNARHVELQMCRDNQGNIKCLGGRDCTLQRRNQKVIEESLILDEKTYEKLQGYSVKLLTEAEYTGVATVEFLLTKENHFFLEVNTRIQVEHPITEIMTKINIPELQVKIALNKSIKDIKIKQSQKHVIGCRILAEDPWNNFLPTTGEFRLEAQFEKNIFGYFNATNGFVNKDGDSQFGHIFIEAKSRRACIDKLARYLTTIFIEGITTNKEFVIDFLKSTLFAKQTYYTNTMETIVRKYNETGLKFINPLEKSQKEPTINFNLTADLVNTEIECHTHNLITGSDIFAIIYTLANGLNFASLDFTDYSYLYNYKIYIASPYKVILRKNNTYHTFKYHKQNHFFYIFSKTCHTKATFHRNDTESFTINSSSNAYKFTINYCESELVAPTDGVIVAIHKLENENITKNERYAEIEIMKTRISLNSAFTGIINLKKTVGDVITKGELIAKVKVENVDEIPKCLDGFCAETKNNNTEVILFANSEYTLNDLKSVFLGYEFPQKLFECFENKEMGDINACVEILKMYYDTQNLNPEKLKVVDVALQKLIQCFRTDTKKPVTMSLLEILEIIDSVIIEKNNSSDVYKKMIIIRQYFSEYKFKYMNMWYNRNPDPKQFGEYLTRHCSYKEGILFSLSFLDNYIKELISKYLSNITTLKPDALAMTFIKQACVFKYQKMICSFLYCVENCRYEGKHDLDIHYNCKNKKLKGHFYITTHNEAPFVIYTYNEIESTVDIITEYLKNKKIENIENLVYKDIFRNLCIYKQSSSQNVVYKIDTHSGNSVLDVKNLSHAIKQILCAIKITSEKYNVKESHFIIIVEGKISIDDKLIRSILEDCIFYYSKGYIEHGVTRLTIQYENDYMYEINISIERGVMEKFFYINNKLKQYIIDDYKVLDSETSSAGTIIKIEQLIDGQPKNKTADVLIKNNTISICNFIYLFRLYFAKEGDEFQYDEYYLGEVQNEKFSDDYFFFNQKKYVLSNVKKIIGMRGFYIKYGERQFMLVMNDILYKNGSFSFEEDIFYSLMIKKARYEKIPFVFVACNAGARLGIFEEIKNSLLVVNNEIHSIDSRGNLSVDSKIVSVFGNIGSGSENLAYSGLVAKETSDAYDDIFYLSYVTGRSVGIGAYINKLGQRIIQKRGSSMLLTGYQALNKVLKSTLYSNNEEIGGTDVMSRNGNTHLDVTSEFEGIHEIIRWLDFYFSRSKNTAKSRFMLYAQISREEKEAKFLNLYHSSNYTEKFTSREIIELICDEMTFREYKRHFGSNIILGRAKINSVSLGIIAPESNDYVNGVKITKNVLDPESTEKIAQAISDFDKEELNILIIANFKGFTGGKNEMVKNILKYGSQIIENLKKCRTKVILYIPPGGEVRGGSWVVFDKFINKNIRILAHPNSQVGIIEPDAMADLKFKEKECRLLFERNNLLYNEKDGDFIRREFCSSHDSVYRLYLNNLIDEILTVEEFKKTLDIEFE